MEHILQKAKREFKNIGKQWSGMNLPDSFEEKVRREA